MAMLSKPIDSIHNTDSQSRENVLELDDSHDVCGTVLPKNGIALSPDMTA